MPVLSLRERGAQVYEQVRSILETLFPGGDVPLGLSAEVKAIRIADEASNEAHTLAVAIKK